MSAKSWVHTANRLTAVKEAPFSWKERDLLTAAERFMQGAIDCSMATYAAACFPGIAPAALDKIRQAELCSLAACHLYRSQQSPEGFQADALQPQAARLYELEAQRLLGSIFAFEDLFWNTFYTRQATTLSRPLVIIDALYFASGSREKIAHQLLIQGFKAILAGYYARGAIRKENFATAKRLLIGQPLPQLSEWLDQHSVAT